MPFTTLLYGCLYPLPVALMLLVGVPLSLCVVPPSDWVKFARLPEAAPMAALLLVVPILQVIVTHHVLLLAPAAAAAPVLLAFTICCELAVFASYAGLLASDGGFIPGGEPEHARRYWEALEQANGRELPSTDHFEPKAEAVRPPRAHFSRMAHGLVSEMDHDCPWIGAPVGKGNHRPFIALLAFGDLALLAHIATACSVQPRYLTQPGWHTEWIRWVAHVLSGFVFADGGLLDRLLGTPVSHAAPPPAMTDDDHFAVMLTAAISRALFLSEVLAFVLVCLITPLLASQLSTIANNVLVVEHLRWRREHPERRVPRRGEAGWEEYAPYDLGSTRRNLLAFVRGTRTAGGGGRKEV